MPRLPRKYIFDESEPGIYHCINRCVRRAFFCGTDPATGECFEHRKVALQERLAFLAGQLGIDILGFAVMSNHIHVVARNRPDLVANWSNDGRGQPPWIEVHVRVQKPSNWGEFNFGGVLPGGMSPRGLQRWMARFCRNLSKCVLAVSPVDVSYRRKSLGLGTRNVPAP